MQSKLSDSASGHVHAASLHPKGTEAAQSAAAEQDETAVQDAIAAEAPDGTAVAEPDAIAAEAWGDTAAVEQVATAVAVQAVIQADFPDAAAPAVTDATQAGSLDARSVYSLAYFQLRQGDFPLVQCAPEPS